MTLDEFTAEGFRPHVGSVFHLNLEDGRVFDLMLEEVKVVNEKHTSPRMKRDAFSLFFVGPENVLISQHTHSVTHDQLGGPWDIFIVPVGRREANFLYEAAFT
jgi:hypothetical protein